MTTQADIDATMQLLRKHGWHYETVQGARVLVSGSKNRRLCTVCGVWRFKRQFKRARTVCDPCCDDRVMASKAKNK